MSVEYHTEDFIDDEEFGAGIFRRDPAFAVLPHFHAFDELVFVRRGKGTHVVDGCARDFQAGDVLIVRAGQCHYYHDVSDFALESVIMVPERLTAADGTGRLGDAYSRCFCPHRGLSDQVRLDPRNTRQASRCIAELKISGSNPGGSSHPASLLANILEYVALGEAAYPSGARRAHTDAELDSMSAALAHLEQAFPQVDALRPLSDLAHMSERTLLRRFHQVTGRSPVTYLLDLRMHHAMLALRTTTGSVTEIAYASGFGDLSYFHRRFHRITGQSPRRWRRQPPHEW